MILNDSRSEPVKIFIFHVIEIVSVFFEASHAPFLEIKQLAKAENIVCSLFDNDVPPLWKVLDHHTVRIIYV